MVRAILKSLLIVLVLLLAIILFLPNFFNTRETRQFDGSQRLNGSYILEKNSDSVRVIITDYYDRGELTTSLLGEHYRELWQTPISLPVFTQQWDTITFDITKLGGGQQTTSFKLLDSYDRNFTLRSVNKDQANAVRPWMKKTGVRSLFRDQASALQPFGAVVAAQLATSAGIPHTHPQMVFVPEIENIPTEYKPLITNRVMLLEVEPNHSWDGQELVGTESQILSTKKVIEKFMEGKLQVDYQAYAYCRLFDVIISDWDRHAKQWKWVVDTTTMIARPFPVDRDMAFYKFNDGSINRLALQVNNKFQSFESEFDDISGYFKNGRELDTLFIPLCTATELEENSERLSTSLNSEAITKAFALLPPEIFEKIGAEHILILQDRIRQIDTLTSFLSNNYIYTTEQLHVN